MMGCGNSKRKNQQFAGPSSLSNQASSPGNPVMPNQGRPNNYSHQSGPQSYNAYATNQYDPSNAYQTVPVYQPPPPQVGYFDADARFDGAASPRVPPPPPGVNPNPAQTSIMYGQPVIMQQKSTNPMYGSGMSMVP